MSAVHIREAQRADLENVLALYAAIEDSAADVLTVEEAQAVWAQFAHYPSYRLWVACDPAQHGAVVGTYALLVMHNLAHRGAPSAIVEDVVVAKDQQGRGIGRQMMAHAMQQAREAGCYKLALSSNARRTGAHAFYESLGFAQHGLSFVVETLT
ncbi:GNAT family N-acetyltransferase [Acidovorax radicis]|jgi:GNAT superfamily N-acetyltransferase|uniref:GNAT family N-acetyltransferase n=1 Tax=Acidovorax radicis TaxID=758826 RepID=UPI001CFAE0A8|nr:GNAT family N-acetyltransferase [Acidovorax radicis]UCU99705.1 GNAT family N-acetyltransferase [Acidovorax radicis]